jgi:cell division protein FtsL
VTLLHIHKTVIVMLVVVAKDTTAVAVVVKEHQTDQLTIE